VTAPKETQRLAAIRKALGREPDLVLWRLSQGAGRAVPIEALERLLSLLLLGDVSAAITLVRELISGRYAKMGLVNGASDLIGILTVQVLGGPHVGRFFALEVKSARGRTSKEQDMFLALVRARGGFAAVVRDENEALAALERARNWESE
jgi:hypothetical protein